MIQLKNEARRALRRTKRQGESVSNIQSLSARFLSLLGEHSRLKRASSCRLQEKHAKFARKECHHNFWRYANQLLDGGEAQVVTPKFSASLAHTFFSEVYSSTPHQFQMPSWMPAPPPPGPGKVMDMSPGTAEELSQVIRRSRSSSDPSPFDRISYTILKRCPSLQPALLDLFNRVIMEGSIPSAWKEAAVKLIPRAQLQRTHQLLGTFGQLP